MCGNDPPPYHSTPDLWFLLLNHLEQGFANDGQRLVPVSVNTVALELSHECVCDCSLLQRQRCVVGTTMGSPASLESVASGPVGKCRALT